jgi:DNA-binding NarL/FixJ family response regulator
MDKPRDLRILLADDHSLFRKGVASELSSNAGIQIVGEAKNGFEAISMAREVHPDIILMDLNMPHCSGSEAAQVIKAEMPDVHILILTVHNDDDHLFKAIKSGADGYLLKDIEPDELVDMLERTQRGEAAIDGRLAVRILNEFRQQESTTMSDNQPQTLTTREHDVLKRLVKGETNQEIATALVITENTVKMHVRNILDKLHLQNRIQAAVYAVRENLVEEGQSQ